MTTSAERMRQWQGPALLTYGFRPFFLGGALWAAAAMALWIAILSGRIAPLGGLDPIAWHAHELLFGYLGAAAAGFLLTAVPNWTGRMPITGWPLAGLFASWIAGRMAMAAPLAPGAAAAIDLAMPVLLAAAIGREIARGRNWRNLIVLAMLVALIAGNALFHLAAAQGWHAAGGAGFRLGLAAGVMMIAVIGGRVVPSFTRNWLVKRPSAARPAPFGRFDGAALAVLLVALAIWVALPLSHWTGAALIAAGLVHAVRMARWAGHRTMAEPLVWVLHAGYAFLPLGALALGSAVLAGDLAAIQAAQHLWMAGGIGLMTLAVMTRATLGHTGRPLTAGRGTVCLYLLLIASVALRLAAGALPGLAHPLLMLSGLGWIAAFGGFALLYGPLLLARRPER